MKRFPAALAICSLRPSRGTGGSRLKRAAGLTLLATLLAPGCASRMPPALHGDLPAAPVSAEQARLDPDRHLGQNVRWGGSVLAVHNHPDNTAIEVLSRPLAGDGKPRPDAAPSGRFLARLAGFLDPAEYPRGRLITVIGTITGIESRAVGEYPYPHPVVEVRRHHLWPEQAWCPRDPACADPYYGYWPWFGPWYHPWRHPWYGPGPWP